jgi:hypothetical protein
MEQLCLVHGLYAAVWGACLENCHIEINTVRIILFRYAQKWLKTFFGLGFKANGITLKIRKYKSSIEC